MGVDPALVDAAARISSRTFRGLSRGDLERFGIETRGVYETPWFAYNGSAREFLLLKSVTYPTGDKGDQFRTRTVALACSPFPSSIRLVYHQELAANETRTPPMIHAKIGDSLIDLSTMTPKNGLVEKSFDFEPRVLQSAIEARSFEFTEVFDQSVVKKPPRVVRFSTLGLSSNIVELDSKCASKSNPSQ
jgi:NADPH-dependent 7-cyano-7-deazaguanine reductase QueF-like protein